MPLDIKAANAVEYFTSQHSDAGQFDAVIANPPYVRWESIPADWHPKIRDILGKSVTARPDLYLPFVKIALDLIKPGGMLLYVLPHAFLMADNARPLREEIAHTCWIRHLVDLSELHVFEESSSYPVLLIAERRRSNVDEPCAIITKCSGFAGHALELALANRSESTAFYSIYTVPQSIFLASNWRVLSPQDYEIQDRLQPLPQLQDVLNVGQGMNSGSDNAFIRASKDVSRKELRVYAPLLRDREMRKFVTPDTVETLMFYPFDGNRQIEEQELRDRFPSTWAHLETHFQSLSQRASVRRKQIPWWRPERPRTPDKILRPKIVGPHLMLFPKFSLDTDGRFLVSRSPYIYHPNDDLDVLKLVLGILNSSIGHWQILTQSHRYSRGYARLEASTLRTFRIPSLAAISPRHTAGIVECVDLLLAGDTEKGTLSTLDSIVSSIYGISLESVPEVVLDKAIR